MDLAWTKGTARKNPESIWRYPPRFDGWTLDMKQDWLANDNIPDLEKVDEILFYHRQLHRHTADRDGLASVSGCPRVVSAVLKHMKVSELPYIDGMCDVSQQTNCFWAPRSCRTVGHVTLGCRVHPTMTCILQCMQWTAQW